MTESSKNSKILVCDDDETLCYLLKEQLLEEGFTVDAVYDGKYAIEAIKSSAVIVIKQPLMLIALIFISGIGAALGIFGFCIGIFFTMPFVYSMNYAVYKAIIGIDDTIEIDE